MGKRKYEDLTLAAPKYRCCFGYLHVQTVTTIACILLFLNSSHDAYKYLCDYERNDWEFFKIIVALGSAAGPLIGINLKKPIYFFTYFIPPIVRSFYYSLILLSLIFSKIFPNTGFGKKFNANFNDKDSRELEKMLRNIPLLVFLFIFVSLLFVLEAWVCYVIYKCYKYIGALSLQGGEYGYQAKKHGKTKRNNSKESTKDEKPLIKSSDIKKYSGYSFAESLFFKKITTPSEVVKAQPKMKKLTDTSVEPEEKTLKPKEAESIQQSEVTKTNSKPVECNLNIQLKNHTKQREAANISVKLKSSEQLSEVSKRISSTKQDLLNPKTSETNQMKDVIADNSKPVKSYLEINLRNNFVKNEATATFTVKLKSTEVIEKVIKSPLNVKPPEAESVSYFQQSYISNTLKPKKFVSTEIQTDETSFDQRIVKKRFKNFDYDSETDSLSPTITLETEEYVCDQKSPITSSSGFASTSDFSPFESVSPNTESASNVTFLFKNDETCAVEISQNGRKEKVKNLFDNEWTPLYFSMAQKNPEIGEKAQIHFHHFREHVLYDIFKIIGKPLNEIKINSEWKFKIVEKNGIKYFQIKTQNGLNLFPENIILATFLKSMKGLAENYLNSEIHEIYVSSNFEFSESQKSVFKNAASKIHLKILSFRDNNF